MRLVLVGILVTLALGARPKSLFAQESAFARIAPPPAQLAASAALRPGTTVRQVDAPLVRVGTDQARGGRREGEILMIVGGAGILTGLLVDESLITIAGAAVGGYGLYLYLRATR
jgi:hypothetical protein